MTIQWLCKHCGKRGALLVTTGSAYFKEISRMAITMHKRAARGDCCSLDFAANSAIAYDDVVEINASLNSITFRPAVKDPDGALRPLLFLFPIQ
jgi:hypothetical protein